MARKLYYSVQQFTGSGYGWEEVTAAETFSEAKQNAREYRENQPEYQIRIKRKQEGRGEK